MSAIIGGSSPSVTFSDGTTQATAFTGKALSASPYTTQLGAGSLLNTTGVQNTAVGNAAGAAVTTGAYNAFFGYNAGLSAVANQFSTYIGNQAGAGATGDGQTFIGNAAGASTSGTSNTFLGANSGQSVTTGTNNTVIGRFNGNNGGLDIRTASNYIVLSDGSGNPRAYCSGDNWRFGNGGSAAAANAGQVAFNGSSASGFQPAITGLVDGTEVWSIGTQGVYATSSSTYFQCRNTSGGVYLNGSGATAWTAVSDERLKENLEPITDAANKVSTLRAVIGNYTWDEDKVRRPFLIAQDVQAVLPEAVGDQGDEMKTLGVAYTDVIPLLVAAIKEQQAMIQSQATVIESLTTRIATLEAK